MLSAAEVRYFYTPDNLIVDHFPQVRTQLQKEGISLESYLENGKFDYIWIASDPPVPVITNYLEKNSYKLVYSYDFAEKPTTFHYSIYRRP